MNKNTKIEIRLTEEMKSKLQEKAQQQGITVSKLIRYEIEKIIGEEEVEWQEKI